MAEGTIQFQDSGRQKSKFVAASNLHSETHTSCTLQRTTAPQGGKWWINGYKRVRTRPLWRPEAA